MTIEEGIKVPPSVHPCCPRDYDGDGNCDRHPSKTSEETKCGSPAEESARKILQGILILQANYPKVSLIGLDKGVYVGPCDDPKRDWAYQPAQLDELKQLGWSWCEEQESWEFYTGHG
jgi:hypothetical protein